MKDNKELDRYYWKIRTIRRLNRLRRKRKGKKRKLTDQRFLLSRGIHLDYFAQTKFIPLNYKSNKKQKELVIKIPKVFSIYENPEKVFDIISTIARAQKNKSIKGIYIDHSQCEKSGLAAETLLASCVSCLDKVKSSSGMKFGVRGLYPENEAISRMIDAIGVVKEVIKNSNQVEKNKIAKTLVFRNESIPKESIDASGGDKKNQTCASFIEYFNNCLDKADRVLSESGQQSLNEYTGEILDNASRHSGTNMWHIYMYMDYTNDNTLNVHIVVYSLGNTIYENFLHKKSIPEVWNQVAKYLSTHEGKFTESDLVTVMAMQQTITSNRDSDKTGGWGTVNFIKFFDSVSNECQEGVKNQPQMTITSGNSQLKFDGSIEMKTDERGYNLIPFNKSGKLESPPDPKYVKSLGEHSFPGVLIGIKFPIKNDSELTL